MVAMMLAVSLPAGGASHGEPRSEGAAGGVARLVSAAPPAVHRPAMAALLCQGRPAAGRLPVLLLVPVPVGGDRGAAHRGRLLGHHAPEWRPPLNGVALSVFI